MSTSTKSIHETAGSIPNLKKRLEISKFAQKTSKQKINQNDKAIAQPIAKIKVISDSWRDKTRLYPPFRQRRQHLSLQKYNPREEILKKSISKPRKFRVFPLVCTDSPFIRNENTHNFGESDFRYLSSGCEDDNKISSICGLNDASCIEPICDQNDEACKITRGTHPANSVCQNVVSVQDDKSDHVSVSDDRLKSRYYMTVCGESIDYAICGSTKTSTFNDFQDEVLRDDIGEENYFHIHDGEYENLRSTSEFKSESELVLESELFQDPLLSHRLIIPYKEMPSSRYCVGGNLSDSLKTELLAKRSSSPVRNIQEGRFDVKASIAKVTKRAEIHDAKCALRISNEFMTKLMMTLNSVSSVASGTSAEHLPALVRVLLNDVILSTTDGESVNDLSLTLTIIWTITELLMTETGSEATQSVTIENIATVPNSKRSLLHNFTFSKASSSQRTSDIGYPPRGSDNHFLHQAIPWTYLCTAHAEGLPKSYDTVRTCIDQVTRDSELQRSRATYLPDISCTHLKEISSRKSMLTPENNYEDFEPENLLDFKEEIN